MIYRIVNDDVLKNCKVLVKVPVDEFYENKSSFITCIVKSRGSQPFFVCDYFRANEVKELEEYDHGLSPSYEDIVGSRNVIVTSDPKVGLIIKEDLNPITSVEFVEYNNKTYIKLGLTVDDKPEEFVLCSILSDVGMIDYLHVSEELRHNAMEHVFNQGLMYLEFPTTTKDEKSIFINPIELLGIDKVFKSYVDDKNVPLDSVEDFKNRFTYKRDLSYCLVDDKVYLDMYIKVEPKHKEDIGKLLEYTNRYKLPVVYNLTDTFYKYYID